MKGKKESVKICVRTPNKTSVKLAVLRTGVDEELELIIPIGISFQED